ncbi:MAG: hypothetical protein ACLFRD_12610, partial [Nitriliruptoraceae bacterium]
LWAVLVIAAGVGLTQRSRGEVGTALAVDAQRAGPPAAVGASDPVQQPTPVGEPTIETVQSNER